MNRLAEYLSKHPTHLGLAGIAEGQCFVRICRPGRWKVTKAEHPTHFAPNGKIKVDVFSCIGYGATWDEAVDEAFKMLPE